MQYIFHTKDPAECQELSEKVNALLSVYDLAGVNAVVVRPVIIPSYGDPYTIKLSPSYEEGSPNDEEGFLKFRKRELSHPGGELICSTKQWIDIWFKGTRYRITYSPLKPHE